MSLTFVADTNATNGATSAAPAAPVGTLEDDFIILNYVCKPSTQTPATPAGWTATTSFVVGTGTHAESSGPMRVGAFYRRVPASLTMPTVSISAVTGSVISCGASTFRPDPGCTVEITSTGGSDTVSGDPFAVTGAAALDYDEGDFAFCHAAVTDNTVTIELEGLSLSATNATFNTFDSRWNSGVTTGYNIRNQAVTAAVLTGPATGAPSISLTPGAGTSTGGAAFYRIRQIRHPAYSLGIDGTTAGNHFKLQAARSGEGAIYEQTQAQLVAGYYENPYFYAVNPSDLDWTQFWVQMDAPTTGGSSYPRSELREMATNGTTDMAWTTASNTHRLRAMMRVTHLPPVKPTVVFAQIHDGTSDALQLVTEKNATTGLIEIKCRLNGTSAGQPVFETNYQLGDVHEFMVEVINGTTYVYWDDLIHPKIVTTAISTTTAYFKVGCYAQSNETIDSATEWMSVEIKNLRAWHTGQGGSDGSVTYVFSGPPDRPTRRYTHLLVR